MVATAVGSIMFVAIGVFGLFSAKSFASIANYVDLDAYSRDALDKLTKDVRQVNHLVSSSSTNAPRSSMSFLEFFMSWLF